MGYGGLDAEWDSYSQFAGVESDSPFSRAPENSFTAGLRHNWDLSMGGCSGQLCELLLQG